MSEFDWDSQKNKLNALKHGMSFEKAQDLWLDPILLRFKSKVSVIGEVRYLMIGQVEGKIWTAIVTERENRIRIISVRRARKNEVKLYES